MKNNNFFEKQYKMSEFLRGLASIAGVVLAVK